MGWGRALLPVSANRRFATSGGSASGTGGSGKALKAVAFQLTPEQACDRLFVWNRSHPFGANLNRQTSLKADATFLPFYLFDTTVVDVRLGEGARIGRTIVSASRANSQVTRTVEWTYVSDIMRSVSSGGGDGSISIHDGRGSVPYNYRNSSGFAVYAAHTYPRHSVEAAIRTTVISQQLQPFRAEMLSGGVRDVDAFQVYPTHAWERVYELIAQVETERALQWLQHRFAPAGYDQFRVSPNDIQLVFGTGTGAGKSGRGGTGTGRAQRVYLPFYAVEYKYNLWSHTALVNAMDGSVGGERQYSPLKVLVGGEVIGTALPWVLDQWILLFNPRYWAAITVVSAAAAVASQFVPNLIARGYNALRLWERRRDEQRRAASATGSGPEAEEAEDSEDGFEQTSERHAREQAAYEQWKEAQWKAQHERNERERARQRTEYHHQQRQSQSGGSGSGGGGGGSVLDRYGHYKLLGFTTDSAIERASLEDIKSAFRREALRNHPDHVPASEKAAANEKMRQIIDAYQHLRKLHANK